MQLKLLVSLLVLGYASAAYLGGKVISVDDNEIQLTGQNGAKVQIYRNRLDAGHGLRGYEITVTGPNFVKRTVHLNDPEGGRLVSEVFVKHQGVVDETTFDQILRNIQRFVQQGEVDPAFYNALRVLDNAAELPNLSVEDVFGQGYYQPHRAGQGYYQGRQGRFQQFNTLHGYQNGHQNQHEGLIEDILEKEAKVETLNEAERHATRAQNVLEREIAREQQQLNQNRYGQNRYQTEERAEDIAQKERQINRLERVQGQDEEIREILEQEIRQEERELNREGQYYPRNHYQGQYGNRGYYNHGIRGQYNGLTRIPLTYQRPSIWNDVLYRTQSPYAFGGRSYRNTNKYGAANQLEREIEREIEGETLGQNVYGRKYGQGQLEREIEQELQQELNGEKYGQQYGRQYENKYGRQYGNQYGRQQQLDREIEEEIEQLTNQHQGQRYGQRYNTYGQRYNTYGQRYNTYGRKYGQQHQLEREAEREIEQEVEQQLEGQQEGRRYPYGLRQGQRYNTYGQRYNTYRPRYNTYAQRYNTYGQRDNTYGQRYNTYGQRYNTYGQGHNTFGYTHYAPQGLFNDYLRDYQQSYLQTPAVYAY